MENKLKETANVIDWQAALAKTYQDFALELVQHLPLFLGAILLLIAGWIFASILRMLTRKVMKGLDKLIFRAAQKKGSETSAPKSYAKLAGDIVFWTILTFFLAASGNMLDWPIFSGIAKSLMLYLPNVISGLLIILVGFGLSGLTRSAVASAIDTAGIAHSDFLSRIAQITVVLTAIVIGVEQLGINLAFISTTLVVAAGVILGGGALAFALGAKYFVANVIGAQTTRKHYHVGQHIRFAEIEGYILEITATTLVVDTPKGRATIPASLIQRNICEIIDEE